MVTQAEMWNAFLARQIDLLLGEYQRMPIAVRPLGGGERAVVHVHVPYMLQTLDIIGRPQDFGTLAPRHQRRLLRVRDARRSAPPEVRAFLEDQFHRPDGSERGVANGRVNAQEIRRLLQAAVDRGLVPTPAGKAHPDGDELRAWLRTYGIGLDCCAFVQHALIGLLQAARGSARARAPRGRPRPGLYAQRVGLPRRHRPIGPD